MSQLMLISIKQKYVDKILSGEKTIELRKSLPKIHPGDTILIYTTQPVKAITAFALAGEIVIYKPETMWRKYKSKLGISRQDFFEYYGSSERAIGIELLEVTKLDADILLSAIRAVSPKFSPPQTFRYISKYRSLKFYNAINSNS